MIINANFTSSYRLGLGAPLPKTFVGGSWNRKGLCSNDKLREQLLGRSFGKSRPQSLPISHKPLGKRKQTQFSTSSSNSNFESDDEGGRSSLGRGKKKKTADKNYTSEREKIPKDIKTPPAGSAQGKKMGSYLDEILNERSKKKRKNKANLGNIIHS